MTKTRTARERSGFTLIELLVVVVVLGILAAITIPKFTASRERAFRSAVIADLRSISSAQELYFANNHTYTADLAALDPNRTPEVGVSINEADNQGWSATATHSGVGSGHCGIYYGAAAPSGGDPAASAGIVQCNF